ncbi:MAG: 50S ribosomal protein L4 [Planctomycetota bacterium]
MTETSNVRRPRRSKLPDPVEVPLFAMDGSERGSRSFRPGPVFNYPNYTLLKEAIRRQQARLRSGTASTRIRSEIRGSNRKPWRQKGTGRARSGTRKSPIWRGGGTTFGPKPRPYDYRLPRRQRRLATRHALLSKLLDGETRAVDSISLERPSAAAIGRILSQVAQGKSCLIGVDSSTGIEERRILALSCRNLPGVELLPIKDFNALSLLGHHILLLTEGALAEVQALEDSCREGIASPAARSGAATEAPSREAEVAAPTAEAGETDAAGPTEDGSAVTGDPHEKAAPESGTGEDES